MVSCPLPSYLRMAPRTFDTLLELLEPRITKQDTRLREAIPADHRLAQAIRFLASGDTFRSCAFNFLTGRSTSCQMIAEVCQAIWDVIGPLCAVLPSSTADWEKLTENEKKPIFNYCLSGPRRIIGNTFGIMVQVWRFIGRPFKSKKENIKKIIGACNILHNFLMSEPTAFRTVYCQPGLTDYEDWQGRLSDGSWRTEDRGNVALVPLPLHTALQGEIHLARNTSQAVISTVQLPVSFFWATWLEEDTRHLRDLLEVAITVVIGFHTIKVQSSNDLLFFHFSRFSAAMQKIT
ncbi:hypothetical protein HPB48_002431 [Haemaphysalis longicornis]|uniref:DDE Tnp4 domain-containing protein n=1 Tax=Haemaphysalis longicornis TaxID=44386 RepID=A0A9J6FBB9_HAELO|nr:hypothetical protein HPB48_002431 [Haemaphysalis longicornis]